MKVILTAVGTLGEVLPFLGVGFELRRRGHDVAFVSNASYENRARDAGLEFHQVDIFDQAKISADESIFGTNSKSYEDYAGLYYFPHMDETYQTISDIVQDNQSALLVGSDEIVRTVAEKHGLPYIFVVLAPGRMRSRYDPAHPERVLPAMARHLAMTSRGLALLHKLNRIRRGQFRVPRKRGLKLPDDHPIARMRVKLGLPPLSEAIEAGAVRPSRTLCLWPDWFGMPQPDWPDGAVTTGFPYYPPLESGERKRVCHSAVEKRPLIVATTGSVANAQFHFYSTVVNACKLLGSTAILVTPHRHQTPDDLPAGITHADHVPFGELFTRAILLIHHGGIGTVAHAVAAGVPQVIMPLRGEQFDIGNRAMRLGVARMLSIQKTSPEQLAATVRTMRNSKQVQRRCSNWKSRVDTTSGLRISADCIEKFIG